MLPIQPEVSALPQMTPASDAAERLDQRLQRLEVFGIPGVVFAVVIGLGTGVAAAFKTPTALWLLWGVFCVALLTGFLCILSTQGRRILGRHLRHPNFTQMYQWLVTGAITWLWARIRPEHRAGNDQAALNTDYPLRTLFGYALSPHLFDGAAKIALLYPILLATGIWIATVSATGFPGAEGGATLPLTPTFFPERAAVLGSFTILIAGIYARILASASSRDFVRKSADWLFWGAIALPIALPFAVAFAAAAAFAFAVAVAFAIVFASERVFENYEKGGLPWRGRGAAIGLALGFVLVALAFIPLESVSTARRGMLVFYGVLPLVNAVFDFLSYAITLTLITYGLRKGVSAWGLGLLDFGIALLLFFGLGVSLILALAGLAWIAGEPLFDLGGLLGRLYLDPRDEWWVIAMVFSTLVPTGLHVLLTVFSL
ncbi:MAG: hypothetical protein AAGI03_17715 [Pseudomonadota bacterium]